jgi:hypothetical protein
MAGPFDTEILDENGPKDFSKEESAHPSSPNPADTLVKDQFGRTSSTGEIAQTASYDEPAQTVADTSILSEAERRSARPKKRKVLTITRNLALVTSGLVLGIVIALTTSYQVEPGGDSIGMKIEKVISSVTTHERDTAPLQNGEGVSQPEGKTSPQGSLVVEARLQELEQWFEQQPVPIEERVFLHRAEESLKTRTVPLQKPGTVESHATAQNGRKGIQLQPVEGKEGRYLAHPQSGIEWQGKFDVNSPGKNREKAEKFLGEVESKLGVSPEEPLKHLEKPGGAELLSTTEQRRFGPKLTENEGSEK